ncbi:cytochrome b5-like Heme/Steroid binding domain protein [Ancylostoma duodenale]|uniref:Cytochrome b5-like Heme/Steroid binding domain protein n=1 Tax=Ancylostoma duodenale TaxID=51022 RepID=A0A0C2DKF0_9BILA|nr:cytochrome b5-like Heme/Steroid binding domain protein [Ancylostoma duodenale]
MGSNDSKPAAGRSEYGRVKVALPPGKGLMDWVRLASGKVLAKKRMAVDHEELMKHNKQNDCWIHIFGQVYDVTSYLEFHPGGIPELMRAAGTDGTDLFNQIHAWVNYENMLKSCLVGRFTVPKPGPSTVDSTDQQPSVSAQLNALIMKGKQNQETYGVTFTMDVDTVILSCPHWYSANLRLENVVVDWSSSKKHFRIVVRPMGNPAIEVKWGMSSTRARFAHIPFVGHLP